jgi:hypothetical protein
MSALISITLYRLGATQVAVIELSVGAGLVTVLLVWAISMVGDDAMDARAILPRPLAAAATLLAAVLLFAMAATLPGSDAVGAFPGLRQALWGERVLDVWIQIVLIFAGVLGVLGLLAEAKHPVAHGELRAERLPSAAPGMPPLPAHAKEVR